MRKTKLSEQILLELQNIHFHLDRMEIFYKKVNGIKEDEKNGVWIEKRNHKN